MMHRAPFTASRPTIKRPAFTASRLTRPRSTFTRSEARPPVRDEVSAEVGLDVCVQAVPVPEPHNQARP
jgi:hypothetical protein